MQRVRLFGVRISPFVEKVERALELKGLPFERVEPRSPFDLLRHNPVTGKMPALEIDGQLLYDSTFIVRELDRRFPTPALLSRDPRVAAAQRQLEDWADESLYWLTMALRWGERNRRQSSEQLARTLPAALRPLARRVLPLRMVRRVRAQGMGLLPYEVLLREYAGHLDDLVCLLDDRPFFYAERPTVADLAVYAQLRTARSGPTPEVEGLLGDRPALADHSKRVEEACARSAWRAAETPRSRNPDQELPG
jgi:glutathione S-transferase